MTTTLLEAPPAAYTGFHFNYIDGRWARGRSSHVVKATDPYDGSVLTEIPGASLEDLNAAFESAQRAQRSWARAAPESRSKVMRRAYDIVVARKEEILEWLIRESGSVRIKAEIEFDMTLAMLEHSISAPYRVSGQIEQCNIPGKECRVYRKPLGVIAVISPWDFALHLSNRSVAPAIAVGNAVVLKPSSDTPVTGALLLAKIFEEAGLPAGVLNAVVGSASEIGDAITLHPVPRLNSFTGSTEVGRHIAINSVNSPIMKRVALELGGNAPLVILDDADLGTAVDAAVFGKFLNQGQICIAINRIIVDERLHDRFVERYVQRVRKLKAGDPKDPDVVIGPIINSQQFNKIMGLIESAKREGATLALGGAPQGRVIPPHIFTGVTADMTIAREEIFGPVASIIRVRGEEEALEVANNTDRGLSSAVITRDENRGLKFALQLEVGMCHINDQPAHDIATVPFGGEKNSGIGRYNGDWILDEFTSPQTITVQHDPVRYPF